MTDARTDVPADDLDRIEHEIYISVEAELVWELVSRPGWWINDGEIDDHPVVHQDGDVSVLSHPEWGDFAIQTVETLRPRSISFRWLSGPGRELGEASTLVEFFVETKPGGVTLRVVESGFRGLSADDAVWKQQREENVEGWTNELRAARSFVTASRG